MNQLSVQSAGWYDILFDGDENPETAFRFIKDCGFDAVDHNLDHSLTKDQIAAREKEPFFLQTREALLEYHRHVIPYTCKNTARDATCLDWEGMLAGLRDIGYKGTLNMETFGALLALPKPLFEPTLRYINAIGEFFQTQLN